MTEPRATLARCRTVAQVDFGTDTEFSRGYGIALFLRDDEHARELVLRSQAWSWSPERLAAFLLGHEQHMRNARCTCHECPIHDGHEMPTRTESN